MDVGVGSGEGDGRRVSVFIERFIEGGSIELSRLQSGLASPKLRLLFQSALRIWKPKHEAQLHYGHAVTRTICPGAASEQI